MYTDLGLNFVALYLSSFPHGKFLAIMQDQTLFGGKHDIITVSKILEGRKRFTMFG